MAYLWLEHLSDTISLRSSCSLSLSAMCAFWRWAFALAADLVASALTSASSDCTSVTSTFSLSFTAAIAART